MDIKIGEKDFFNVSQEDVEKMIESEERVIISFGVIRNMSLKSKRLKDVTFHHILFYDLDVSDCYFKDVMFEYCTIRNASIKGTGFLYFYHCTNENVIKMNVESVSLFRCNFRCIELYGSEYRVNNSIIEKSSIEGVITTEIMCSFIYGVKIGTDTLSIRESKLIYCEIEDIKSGNFIYSTLHSCILNEATKIYVYKSTFKYGHIHKIIDSEIKRSVFDGTVIDNEFERTLVHNTPGYYGNCPEGEFIGYKRLQNGIAKLLILKDAKRCSATNLTCRASKVKVLEIRAGKGYSVNKGKSIVFTDFVYKVGEIIEVKDFDENRFKECSTGIHFYIRKEDAINYI